MVCHGGRSFLGVGGGGGVFHERWSFMIDVGQVGVSFTSFSFTRGLSRAEGPFFMRGGLS